MSDWRNEESYQFSNDYPSERWAWEFLRRNPDYRACWDVALQAEIKERPRVIDQINKPESFIHSIECWWKWGLGPGYINPDQDSPEEVYFHKPGPYVCCNEVIIPHSMIPIINTIKIPYCGIPLTESKVAVIFDLSIPLKLQLETIEEDLKQIQSTNKPKSKRSDKNKYRTYLLVFDAKSEGAKNVEIAAVVFPE